MSRNDLVNVALKPREAVRSPDPGRAPRSAPPPGTAPPPASGPADDDASSGGREMVQSLPHLIASVQARHPTAPPALVERCVSDGLRHYRDSRVRSFLPILVERWARQELAQADGSPDSLADNGPTHR